MQETILIGTGLIVGLGIVLWYLLQTLLVKRQVREAAAEIEERRKRAVKEAEGLKKEKLLESKQEFLEWRTEAESDLRRQRQELEDLERRVVGLEEEQRREAKELRRRQEALDEAEKGLRAREAELEQQHRKAAELVSEQTRRLEAVAGMTAEEAKRHLREAIEQEARHDAAMLAKRIEEETREKAEAEARKVIVQAIQRCAAEHVVESTVSVVDLPSDDMKGRIIGREGRNIRALEQATGVDLIVDDTPEAVILSAFDPLRREIARQAIERLIKDGRIHPARIEEVVEKVQQEMEDNLAHEGEQIAFELGIHDLAPELLRMLGRLKYRTSYGQNVLYHSREVAYLAGIMAREVGADVGVCTRAGLLHDVGKAVDREMEGTHLQLGVELARKHGQSPDVIHAMEAHHFDVEFRTLEAVLVQSADALSAARPGARREVLENYVKRLEKLESLAGSFDGVAKAFALQAGREVRIIVESSQVTDEQAFWLTKDIAKKIEGELQYPGQIKVTLIREMRVVDYAK